MARQSFSCRFYVRILQISYDKDERRSWPLTARAAIGCMVARMMIVMERDQMGLIFISTVSPSPKPL